MVYELKSPTIWIKAPDRSAIIVETTHFESDTSAITILPVLAQIEDPPEFLLKHHVQREGIYVTMSPIDFFVEIGKAADGEQHIDIFIKWPLFYSGNVNFVKFLFGHGFRNRIPYLYKDTLPSIHLSVIK